MINSIAKVQSIPHRTGNRESAQAWPQTMEATLKRSKVITRAQQQEGDNEKMRRKMPKL